MSKFKNIKNNSGNINIVGDKNSDVQQIIGCALNDDMTKKYEDLIKKIEENIPFIDNKKCKEKTEKEIREIKEDFKKNRTITEKIKAGFSKIVEYVDIAFDSVTTMPGEWAVLITALSQFCDK